MMIQRSSRTTSLLGSSLNSSQLSLYSHASSRSAGNSSHYDSRTEAGNRPTRVSSGGQAQASRFVSGNGYLTSSRTPNGAKSQSKTKRMISEARERRKQERRKTHIHVHALAEEKSLDGATGVNGDLESYLMSFSQDVEGGGKATKTKGKSVLPRGSELDWDKLLESGDSLNGTQSDDDNVFEDHSDLDGSALLKRSMKMDSADPPPGSHIEQTMDRLRKTSIISSDIKFLDENSSPNVNDIVLTDSLDGSSSSTHAPMATDRLRQAHVHTRNLLSDSDRGLESNALGDIRKAADLNSSNDIDINAAQSSDRSKPVTMRNLGGASLNPPDDSVTISEEQSISELFDFKQNVTSSIDLLEADINELHDQSEESSFEQNLYDVHSLRELEELEDRPSHSDKAITKLSAGRGRGENTLTTKTSASTKREQSPFQSPPLKPKLSGFKFSAATTTLEEISTNQHKVVSYSSDEFESESVSEVESMAGSNDSGEEIEESVASHSGGEMAESVASNLDDSDDDRTEERGGGGGREHSELSYSSFSEAEQKDKSGKPEYINRKLMKVGSRKWLGDLYVLTRKTCTA